MVKKTLLLISLIFSISCLAYAEDTARLSISIFIPPHLDTETRVTQDNSTQDAISSSIDEQEKVSTQVKQTSKIRNGKKVFVKTVLPK